MQRVGVATICIGAWLWLAQSTCSVVIEQPPTSAALGAELPPPSTVQIGGNNIVLMSSNGLFVLDVGTWLGTSSAYCMAGTRSLKINPTSMIWAAAGAQPVPIQRACWLHLATSGDLLLMHDSNPTPAWQSRTAGTGASSLTLLDSGNLVLQDPRGSTVWQSSQQPTLFWLFSGTRLSASSSLLSERPQILPEFGSPGIYGMALDRRNARLSLFSLLSGFVYKSYVAPSSEVESVSIEHDGLVFYDKQAKRLGSIPPNHTAPSGAMLAAMVFDYTGDLQTFYFAANSSWELSFNSSLAACERPRCTADFSLCDPLTLACSCPPGFSDTSNGSCAAPSPSSLDHCGHPSLYAFASVNVSFPPQLNGVSLASQQDCVSLCASNCTCRAALWDAASSGCSLFAVLKSVAKGDNDRQVLLLKVAKGQSQGHRSFPMGGIIGGVTGIALLGLALGCIICYRRRRRAAAKAGTETEELFLASLPRLPPRYTYKELEVATKGFSVMLGEGGCGCVYEGVLKATGKKVAVKRLEGMAERQTVEQFRAEVASIGSLSHVNVVALKGFCMEGEARLLVYEHMARGSLDRWLFRPSRIADASFKPLDWETRCQVALDAARGLAYLHHECEERIVHCDVKPENILVDEAYGAKVADFGLAKLMGREHHSFALTTLKGTRGYLAPEWLQEATITAKSDVYSFGVVLLELVSGRRCIEPDMGYLPAWAMRLASKSSSSEATSGSCSSEVSVSPSEVSSTPVHDDLIQLVDGHLRPHVPASSFKHVVFVALWCLQPDPVNRPSMLTIVQMLQGLVVAPPPPTDSFSSLPSFVHRDDEASFVLYHSNFGGPSPSPSPSPSPKPTDQSLPNAPSSCLLVSQLVR